MTVTDYYDLTEVEEIEAASLAIPRARKLLDAVHRHRDYSLLRLFRRLPETTKRREYLVVDVECDGVPSQNAVGIRFRERLALCVPEDPRKLVEVVALRHDFPILMHQNQGVVGAPASLCLYFESPASVLRTWTPMGFLRRIQWWLEQSARGELHAADQPVEHLFFTSKYELILPWNVEELRRDRRLRFQIFYRERPDGGTFFLLPASSESGERRVAHVEVTLSPIVHGFVERDPASLGELAEILARRGVDFLSEVRKALQEGVPVEGVPKSGDDVGTVVLLHIPLKRSVDGEIERIARRAFIVPVGPLELGVKCGALIEHDGRYFRDFFGQTPQTEWRDEAVQLVEVLTCNDAVAARRQSGIKEPGPLGVLIGAGSLGSALINLWGRSGWGLWTVVDNDHIKPHNLSRHTAYAMHIGEHKATAVAGLHDAVMEGATKVVPLVVDALQFHIESWKVVLEKASLVVDASTTLEYPRAASAIDTLPRHISVFVTPDGNGAALLAEDAARRYRLRTLEAQYYRALIRTDFGRVHLAGSTETFWSGASCRDISAVLPYSRILVHAATLAEQVEAASSVDDAVIRIWQRDSQRGTVEVHDVPVYRERRIALGELDVYIDEGVEQELKELRRQNLPNETGGILLGFYDFNVAAVVVVAALPAPPDSKAAPDSFERGVVGLAEAVKNAASRTGGMVGYIGEWHSHPPGASSSPSKCDLLQLIHLTLGMAEDDLPAIQLIVGERDIEVLQGQLVV